MIIFWIFTLFVGSSAFAFAYIFLQVGVAWSLGYAVLAMLLARGLLSIVRRSLIIRERITPETDVLQRTVETNRAIFWKRALYLSAVPILYFLAAFELFGLQLLQDRLPYWIPSFGTETKDTLIRIVSRKRRQIHAGNGPQ